MSEHVNPWRLTKREVEVLNGLSKVGTAKYVARDLDISHKTVEVHMGNIMARMGVKSRLLAVVRWDRWWQAQRSARANDVLLSKLPTVASEGA